MAPRTLAIAALAAIITVGAAHAQYYQPPPPIQNAVPAFPTYVPPPPPQYMPPPALPAPMPSPYRVIVPSYGGTGGYNYR